MLSERRQLAANFENESLKCLLWFANRTKFRPTLRRLDMQMKASHREEEKQTDSAA